MSRAGQPRVDTLLGMDAYPPPSRPSQSRAVALLVLALAALLTLWGVGGYLLYTWAPADFGEPAPGTATPSAPR